MGSKRLFFTQRRWLRRRVIGGHAWIRYQERCVRVVAAAAPLRSMEYSNLTLVHDSGLLKLSCLIGLVVF